MNFNNLLALLGDEPIFESSFLLAGEISPAYLRLQLTRWKNAGRIYQLRRGLYALAPPYQKRKIHPFVVANRLRKASYISCQSALGFYGLIPENLHQTISVTSKRSGKWDTPLGIYHFRHIKAELLRTYKMINLGENQQALVATPEKALLDLIYLEAGGDSAAYLKELRLQNLEKLDLNELHLQAKLFNTLKLYRALEEIIALVKLEDEYEVL